jgi:hypothetical protein
LLLISIAGGTGTLVNDIAICGIIVAGTDTGAGINGTLVSITGAFLLGTGVKDVGLFVGTTVEDEVGTNGTLVTITGAFLLGTGVKDVGTTVEDDVGTNGTLVTKTGAFILGTGVKDVGLFEAMIGTKVEDDGVGAGVFCGNAGLRVGASESGALVEPTGAIVGRTSPGVGTVVLGACVVPVGAAGTEVGIIGFGAGEMVAALHVAGGSLDKSQIPAFIQSS